MKQYYIPLILSIVFFSCNNSFEHDASGTFEATEVSISSEIAGKIEALKLEEGDYLAQGQYVGYIDSTQLYLRKQQLLASGKVITARRPDMSVQIASLKEQIAKEQHEKNRIEKLLLSNAATQKQLDDVNSLLNVLEKRLEAEANTLSISLNSLSEESSMVEVQIAQVEDLLRKSRIINPIEGTVLNKYVERTEVVTEGKALYKIADTKNLFLRAYIISEQLEQVKLGQNVTVYINQLDNKQKTYSGKVTWIANKAEFTPKTIQTRDERQNLVYAIKIAVLNTDGLIKIGMYGDVDF